MSRLVVLSLSQGNIQDGFPTVTVQLGEADNPYQMKFTGSLPAAPEIAELYRNWQSLYSAFYQRLNLRLGVEEIADFEIEEGYVTNVSEVDIKELSIRLAQTINAWLNSTEFRKIDQQLRTQLKPSEEIHFIIETNDNLLRRLPWHLWNFFDDYPYAEVALSALDYQQQHKLPGIARDKVRILAVLGNSKGIDISQDRSFLNNLSDTAEIKFLVETHLGNLNDELWQQGWDILFFAGHSSSKQKGLLQINQTDTITLDQLKYALKQAISYGLKLAIFNSCDSLGLAIELQDLHIPQVIVMREPVPDVVAQEFLKHFLAEFSSGQSLYVAMRLARERLQGLEAEYPCATWLPIICQNPAEPPMIWSHSGVLIPGVDKASCLLTASAVSASNEQRVVPPPWGNTTAPNCKSKPLFATKRVRNRYSITKLQRWHLLVVSVLVAVSVMGVRHLGMLQPWELQSYDHLMQLRPADEKPDPRLLIVTIDEEDIQYQQKNQMKSMRWSLSDQALAQLLPKLEQYQPITIGIDIYRDFFVDPDYPDLATRLQQDQRLIGLCKVAAPDDDAPVGTLPPPEVPKERLSFSDFVADSDDIARRQLLHLIPPLESNCSAEYAFSFQVAQHYLKAQGIKWKINSQGNLQIRDVVFQQLKSHTSGYQAVDASGYQLLLNYRKLPSPQKIAAQVALRQVLNGEINPELVTLVKDRIVLIGVTTPSTADHWKTPYSASTLDNEKQIPGVFVQAQMVSHILSAVLDERPLFWWWAGWVEALWIWGWSLLGGIIAWRLSQPLYLGLAVGLAQLTVFAISFSLFTQSGWIPLVPSALALVASAVVMKLLPHYSHLQQKQFEL